jgi:hypothetical protein
MGAFISRALSGRGSSAKDDRAAVEAVAPADRDVRRLEPRIRSAEAEADGEHRGAGAALRRPQVVDAGANVIRDQLGLRLAHVGHEFEVRAALRDTAGAAEVVEGDAVDAVLGEP